MKLKRKRSNKGKIIKNHKEFVEYVDYSSLKDVPDSKVKGRGIYALYNDHGLYYIGLTNRSIRSRLRRHTKNRHKGKWNRFSWYQIPRIEYVKDVETALLRIVNPPGNKVKGRFRKKTRIKIK